MRVVWYCSVMVLMFLVTLIRSEQINTGGPSVVYEGEDALLTCVIMGTNRSDTVLWRKGPTQVLAAGLNRVTKDKRISVLHDDTPIGSKQQTVGGDVWVLLIKSLRPSDTDVYVCEVNSDPTIKSFHPLQVRKRKENNDNQKKTSSPLPPPPENSLELQPPHIESNYENFAPALTHDFTDCCVSFNVSARCLGFCAIHNILDGTTGMEPESCENDFPSIIECMADGRNHMPCCARKQIPDLCQDMCRGEYTPVADALRSRISCAAHTVPGLECILEGIDKIPSPPLALTVDPINERALQISWMPPLKLASKVMRYVINVTALPSFDNDGITKPSGTTVTITVPGNMNATTVRNLTPFTMYSIVATSENEYGSSLESERIRALTLSTGGNTINGGNPVAVIPKLPDVRSCCIAGGVTHRMCLDKMCDPVAADFAQLPDLMVCAPWANITFACLANGIDHTPCCRGRGLPDVCLGFCDGRIRAINFNAFRCLQHMADYSSCLLQGYGVLPGAPLGLRTILISDHYAVIEWKTPKVLSDTVNGYHLSLRKLGSGDEYTTIERPSNGPTILDNLEADANYEVFVVAVNVHGKSLPSPRLVFQTRRIVDVDPISPAYNMTLCCRHSGLLPQCMALCTYDIKMSDLQTLGSACLASIGSVVRCGAGGRDHSSCCERRGVSKKCMPVCKGVLTQPNECIAYAGNIISCFEEGTGNIPAPIENLHATAVSNTSITVSWSPPLSTTNDTTELSNITNDNNSDLIDYQVQYGKVDSMTMFETVIMLDGQLNTTDTEVDLNDLSPNSLYRIMVVARGKFGNSLPSAMLLINTSSEINTDSVIYGAPSPPHSLTVSSHGATFVTVSWLPPEFSHPHERISYRMFHRTDNNVTIVDTKMLWARLNRLTPNTRHIIFLTAIGSQGTSAASETLIVWTDPALPAFVDPPTIHPSDFVAEGGSMTVLCLALGNPVPTVKLYIGGHLVRQDTSRHMVTVIHNVTTDMAEISCYADNGYGVPMQASKKIAINYSPRIQAAGIQVASIGDEIELKCTIKSRPIPKIVFWKDQDGRIPVIQGGNYDMTMRNHVNDPESYSMILKIAKMTTTDFGDYFCHAENALGSATRPVSVRMKNAATVTNVAECCAIQNVTMGCRAACSFYLDIEAVIDRPECLVDFDKLMKCASDGSDHRGCCATNNVPRRCLNWCRGEPVLTGATTCAIQHTRSIVGCFQENHNRLPGPPLNLHLEKLADDKVLVKWDPPKKNPATVEGYRIFWYSNDFNYDNNTIASGLGTTRLDAKETSITISGLKHNIMYELVVKAGNHYGASVLSQPLRFTLDDQITSSQSTGNGGVVGGIFAGLLAILVLVAIVVVVYIKTKKSKNKNANGGVAFENPSYLRETNVEHVHIQTISSRPEQQDAVATDSNIHHIPTASEVNPTLYEEFKLGTERGFKKLVS